MLSPPKRIAEALKAISTIDDLPKVQRKKRRIEKEQKDTLTYGTHKNEYTLHKQTDNIS